MTDRQREPAPTIRAELIAGALARRDEPLTPDTREDIEARLVALLNQQNTPPVADR